MSETENVNTEQTETVAEDNQENIQETVEDVKSTKETAEDSKKSTISKIGDMVKNFVSGKEDSESSTKEGTDIPDEFTEAALANNWTEDDIIEFASEYSDEELLEMIPSLMPESDESDSSGNESVTENQEQISTKVKDSQEGETQKKLLERIEALEKAQSKLDKETENQELIKRVHRADQIFDEASKEFGVFGKTNELPKFPGGKIIPTSPQMKARNEVWNIAALLTNSGMDFENAMSVSLSAYKGKNLEKDVKRNLIKDLKKGEKKLSGKHTSHETTNTIQYGPDVIKEVIRRHGKETT